MAESYARIVTGIVQGWDAKHHPVCVGCQDPLAAGETYERVQTCRDVKVEGANRLETIIDGHVDYRAGCGPFAENPGGAPRLCHRAADHQRVTEATVPAKRRGRVRQVLERVLGEKKGRKAKS